MSIASLLLWFLGNIIILHMDPLTKTTILERINKIVISFSLKLTWSEIGEKKMTFLFFQKNIRKRSFNVYISLRYVIFYVTLLVMELFFIFRAWNIAQTIGNKRIVEMQGCFLIKLVSFITKNSIKTEHAMKPKTPTEKVKGKNRPL